MIIEILKLQLEAANATILSMSEEMKSMRRSFEATISELQKTIANLESLLKERDESLGKAKAQMRGLKATYLPKQSEKQTTAPKSLAARPPSLISILPEAPVSSAVNVKLLVVLEKLTLTPTSLLALISVRTVSSAVSLV